MWCEKFDKILTLVVFVVNEADKCVNYRYAEAEGVVSCLYMDDIIIFGNSINLIKEVKDFLFSNFKI